ncbi:MAG: ATPase [Hyphomicrobiaceae bacterium]|nr:MAG: ATPase [Hyphomicrobiaceae bacterium]
MSLRPVAASWFELITVRRDLTRAVACLARTGAVELEADAHQARAHALPDLDPRLKGWSDLARRYGAYWPAAQAALSLEREPAQALDLAVDDILAWRAEADPLIDRIERLGAEGRDLELLRTALAAPDVDLPPLDLMARAQGRIAARLIAYPQHGAPREVPPVLLQRIDAGNSTFFLVVGRPADVREIVSQAAGHKGSVVPLPDWLPAGRTEALERIAVRQQALSAERKTSADALAALSHRHGVAEALGIIKLVEWLGEHARELRASERLVWATGWTSDGDGARLRAALQKEGVHALVRIGDPPPGRAPPILMRNPRWMRGFETFVRMLGTPTASEADPTALLAVIAPLLFGFMFADVGQGLVVAAAGLVMKRRAPFLAILVPGGLLAALFGVLFGSVFCREDVIPALWLSPLSRPLTMLIAALVSGAAIISLGLLLDAVQAHWRGLGAQWWSSRAGLAVAYAGLLAAPLSTKTLWLTALGGLWFIAGTPAHAGTGRLAAMTAAAAAFIEQASQLAINTLSFVRIGAFALAHAGLGAAVVGLAEAAGGMGYWVVLALGNALIILLEGLVVGIQTTRLVLFEFFIRFLKGGGRQFKPLTPPGNDRSGSSQPLHQPGSLS